MCSFHVVLPVSCARRRLYFCLSFIFDVSYSCSGRVLNRRIVCHCLAACFLRTSLPVFRFAGNGIHTCFCVFLCGCLLIRWPLQRALLGCVFVVSALLRCMFCVFEFFVIVVYYFKILWIQSSVVVYWFSCTRFCCHRLYMCMLCSYCSYCYYDYLVFIF